jgi:hypothetical protein
MSKYDHEQQRQPDIALLKHRREWYANANG